MATQTKHRRQESNGAESIDVQSLVESLNGDLAGELQAIGMYIGYAATLTGPHRRELRPLFLAEIADELRHAQFLADKIAVLGGEPKMVARTIPMARDAKEMLLNVYGAEQTAIADYQERARQAEAFGDVGLKVQLENQINDETRHKEEVEQILNGWDDDDD